MGTKLVTIFVSDFGAGVGFPSGREIPLQSSYKVFREVCKAGIGGHNLTKRGNGD